MPQRRKPATPAGPTPVEALVHDDKRLNIPTADAYDFVDEEAAKVETLRYPRDPSLDPQLVWKGKDEQDGTDLVVDAPPIFIQEKIDPRVIIENLRDTAGRDEREPELTLFDSFDGLEDWQTVEFYRHPANWSNRMILGDALYVMGSLAEKENLRGQIQAIYVDPPYGVNFSSNWQASTRQRRVHDRAEDATREPEQIKAFRDTWELGIHSYLSYLRDRLVIARDLLTDSGSIFVQIGDENLHLVRSILDEIFGRENFRSVISMIKTAGLGSEGFPSVTDFVLWYAKDLQSLKSRALFIDKEIEDDPNYKYIEEPNGDRRLMTREERSNPSGLTPGKRVYRDQILLAAGRTESCIYEVEFEEKRYWPGAGRSWATNAEGMERLRICRRIMRSGNNISYVRYANDFPVKPLSNFWPDSASGVGMNKIYVVQTNEKVIRRCILLSTGVWHFRLRWRPRLPAPGGFLAGLARGPDPGDIARR